MTIQTPEQVAEALERDDCKPWDEDFRAAVVAAIAADRRALLGAEREKVAAMMLRLSIATGHGDTLDDLLVELEGQLKEIMR